MQATTIVQMSESVLHIIKELHSLNLRLPMQPAEMVHSITSMENIVYQINLTKQ